MAGGACIASPMEAAVSEQTTFQAVPAAERNDYVAYRACGGHENIPLPLASHLPGNIKLFPVVPT